MANSRGRIDKKHKYLLSIEQKDFRQIKAIAYNCDISIQKVIELLVVEALNTGYIVDKVYAAYPPPEGGQFVIVREDD